MIRVWLCLAGALLALWSPPAAAAQDVKWVRGTIAAIGADDVTVKVRDQEMKFLVDENTRAITRGGATQTRAARAEGKPGPPLGDVFKGGEGVEVRYRQERMYAVSIRSLPGTPAGATSEDEPAAPAMTAVGVVSAVSGTSLSVKGKTQEWSFAVGSSTEVIGVGAGTAYRRQLESGGTTAISDFVTVGDTVRVTYRDGDGLKYAMEVRITTNHKR